MMTPPCLGMAPPAMPVPAPRATIGTPLGVGESDDRLHVVRRARQGDDVRHRAVEPVVVLVHDHVFGRLEDRARPEALAQDARTVSSRGWNANVGRQSFDRHDRRARPCCRRAATDARHRCAPKRARHARQGARARSRRPRRARLRRSRAVLAGRAGSPAGARGRAQARALRCAATRPAAAAIPARQPTPATRVRRRSGRRPPPGRGAARRSWRTAGSSCASSPAWAGSCPSALARRTENPRRADTAGACRRRTPGSRCVSMSACERHEGHGVRGIHQGAGARASTRFENRVECGAATRLRLNQAERHQRGAWLDAVRQLVELDAANARPTLLRRDHERIHHRRELVVGKEHLVGGGERRGDRGHADRARGHQRDLTGLGADQGRKRGAAVLAALVPIVDPVRRPRLPRRERRAASPRRSAAAAGRRWRRRDRSSPRLGSKKARASASGSRICCMVEP